MEEKEDRIREGVYKIKDFVTVQEFAKEFNIPKDDAKDILDNGESIGVFYTTLDKQRWDLKEYGLREVISEETKKEFKNFLTKFFKGKRLNKEIEEILDKRKLACRFLEITPLYFDVNKIWWSWDINDFFWDRIDETDILNSLNFVSKANTINSKEKNELLEALRQEARLKKPKDTEPSWVQFNEIIFDINSLEELKASSEYFISNPIKWVVGLSEETPRFDKLFKSWVGKEHIEELYELLAFCIVPSYFIHRQFCLIGSGANGKSTFLKILEKFIGEENITSSSLRLLLTQRFEGSKLLKKLVCLIGETDFNLISNTDFLKKVTGEDTIRCEFKGKDGFDFRNYAKLIMATNSLPPTADKTEGFYRRWKIIDFPNKFDKEKDVLSEIPDEEYENLAFKCLKIAKRLWKERIFTNDGSFEERKNRYEERSNPLMKFVKENYVKENNGEVLFQEFFEVLNIYLEERGHRTLSAIAVSKQLKVEGFDIKTLQKKGINGRFILGLQGK